MKKLFLMFMCAFMLPGAAYAQEIRLPLNEVPLFEDADGLAKLGIVAGRAEGMALDEGLTRAEAAAFTERTVRPVYPESAADSFADIIGHWAEESIVHMRSAGIISGVNADEFAPEREVTGVEMTIMLMRALGHTDVTTETVFEAGKKCCLLQDNFTKSIAASEDAIRRGDAIRLCYAALTANTKQGDMLYQSLIERNIYAEDAFDGILYASCTDAATFADKINELMPQKENYMFSPLSIRMAFAMAANGAKGDVQKEILSAFEIENLDAFNAYSAAMIEKYRKSEIMKLDIANSLWVNSDHAKTDFSDSFKNRVKAFYDAEAQMVNDDNAMEIVNGWVSEKTHEKINSVLDEPKFENLLVNAVYFKGDWIEPFKIKDTYKEKFTDCNGKVSSIDFMHRTGYMKYCRVGGCDILSLPYKNYEYAGDELVRHDDIDVSIYLIKGAVPKNPAALLDSGLEFSSKNIQLSLPKFESEFSCPLNDIMQELGIEKAFEFSMDFSPMITAPIEFKIKKRCTKHI